MDEHQKQEIGCLLGIDDSQDLTPRRKFRYLLFHVLYAADAFDYQTDAHIIASNFNREYGTDIDLHGEIPSTVNAIGKEYKTLDEFIVPHLENWKIERIGICTLLSIRIAVWEFLHTKTPHKIIINEAIELAKTFAEKDAYKFVNGILDKVSKALQPDEEQEPSE
jgi:N utilization substance protein B